MRDLNPRHPAPKAGALPDCANLRNLRKALPLRDAHITDFPYTRQHFLIAFLLLLAKDFAKSNLARLLIRQKH